MMQKSALTAIVGAGVSLSGCATVMNSGPRSIPVSSTPPGAKVSIYDRSERLVVTNTTPFVAVLSTKYKYFRGQQYRLVFDLAGHEPAEVKLKSKRSGWYLGNVLVGGLPGLLVVDPITGAMYYLTPEEVDQPLTPLPAEVVQEGEGVPPEVAAESSSMPILPSSASPGGEPASDLN